MRCLLALVTETNVFLSFPPSTSSPPFSLSPALSAKVSSPIEHAFYQALSSGKDTSQESWDYWALLF